MPKVRLSLHGVGRSLESSVSGSSSACSSTAPSTEGLDFETRGTNLEVPAATCLWA